jgi:hypothetical protein
VEGLAVEGPPVDEGAVAASSRISRVAPSIRTTRSISRGPRPVELAVARIQAIGGVVEHVGLGAGSATGSGCASGSATASGTSAGAPAGEASTPQAASTAVRERAMTRRERRMGGPPGPAPVGASTPHDARLTWGCIEPPQRGEQIRPAGDDDAADRGERDGAPAAAVGRRSWVVAEHLGTPVTDRPEALDHLVVGVRRVGDDHDLAGFEP